MNLRGSVRGSLNKLGSSFAGKDECSTTQEKQSAMQNYLISHVLFDGREDVLATSAKTGHGHDNIQEDETNASGILTNGPLGGRPEGAFYSTTGISTLLWS